ncbi:tRNA (N6-threonylcarbamoyladenosine(37)-N6)-methyltransferase TrmO [bacterium DOLZORAL124_64_63]|nr:MAG: tRNA (N6-threonylcarbamoyladenosine(37)-N6)-methyltransferase TrmO [bacterium DOLZORAL124_64_63]
MNPLAQLTAIGVVRSELKTLEDCPKQGYEGAPSARIDILPPYRDALLGMKPGARVAVLTWLHNSDRDTLVVHPRHNPKNPLTGVFLTRSPNRPNPIGLHEVTVTAVDETGLTADPLEALDGTPVIDIKISLPPGKKK